jgi:hypothetical protein
VALPMAAPDMEWADHVQGMCGRGFMWVPWLPACRRAWVASGVDLASVAHCEHQMLLTYACRVPVGAGP